MRYPTMPYRSKGLLAFVLVVLLCMTIISSVAEGATKVDLESSKKGDSWVLLSWSRSDDGSNFLRYEVLIDEGQGYSSIHSIDDIDKTNYEVRGLSPDTKYRFKIRDVDRDLLEEDSDPIEVTTNPKSLPGFDIALVSVSIPIALMIALLRRRRIG